MKILEKTAETIEEAIDIALKDLNVSIENVEVEVMQQPSKGFLGIGRKNAIIKVIVKHDPVLKAKEFLNQIFHSMNLEVEMIFNLKEEGLYIELKGKNMGVIIGKRGETLDSLQYLTSLVVNKDPSKEHIKVILDTENYRAKREEVLVHLAQKLANQVKKTRNNITLEPMNPYERKIIHATLQNHPFVNTHSEGDEPYRKVVITLK